MDLEDEIPEGVSPLRFIMNQTGKDNTTFIKGLDTARNNENAIMVMEGDYGGQIYMTCPVKYIHCQEGDLNNLLEDLDDIAWGDQGFNSRNLTYEVRQIGEEVWGGMGGSMINDGLWIHDEFNNIRNQIQEVINGKRKRIEKEK